ncbi:MAG TPA: type II toxin-antitoxin system PemK/MazF family toxin [Stellaceae bacterium]|nr:type II toxin-antitoxin system PemK/MazF family toxin [Stellaceae bacterium]
MPSFEPWDVIKIPLPDGAGPAVEHRPALVVAAGRLEAAHELVWALMITSASHAAWPSDVPISDLHGAGLPAPSVVRCAKIATIDTSRAKKIGVLTRPAERAAIARHLALAVASTTGRQSNA